MLKKAMSSAGLTFSTIALSVSLAIPADVSASEHVRGHMKKDGKYIAPHNRTNANKTQRDNWSSKGNTNPYTGKSGHKTPKK